MKLTIKLYCILYIVLSILGMLAVIGINLYCDPAHIFSSAQYEQKIADILLSGKNVKNVSENFDLRSVEKKYISGLTMENQVIVLGSSRSMQITGEFFPGKTFFNHSVTSGAIKDYLSIYELYEQHNYSPSTVVLGLDSWILNRNSNLYESSLLNEEYYSMINRLNISESVVSKPSNTTRLKYTELVSLPYFQQSIKQLLSGEVNIEPQATENTDFTSSGISSDGSRIWSQADRNKTTAEIEASAIEYANRHPVAGLADYTVLDAEYQLQLVEFVKYLQAKNTEVFFFFPPYHPAAYQILINSDDYSIINQAESSLKEIAKNLGVTVIGSYDPDKSLCTADEFYDGSHPKETAVFKSFVAAGLVTP